MNTGEHPKAGPAPAPADCSWGVTGRLASIGLHLCSDGFVKALIVVWLAGGCLLLLRTATAQEPAPPSQPNPEAPATSESEGNGARASEDQHATEPMLREQSIYIPYEKLRKVFEKQGRGVFLPYEKFQELWKAARDKSPRPQPEKPPVAALVTETTNEATVSDDVVRVEATVRIDVLRKGWIWIPLRLSDAAIGKATIDGQPARITFDAGQGHRLLYENKDERVKQIELTLEYAKAIERAPGRNSVSFEAPRAAVSRWRVRIPESGVKVNVDPMIAATEVPGTEGRGGEPTENEDDDPSEDDEAEPNPEQPAATGETVLMAFVGSAPRVTIQWTPKAEGATGLEALATVKSEQQIWISEGLSRSRVKLDYTISRAELKQLTVLVPADHKVVNVVDANVRKWSLEPVADDDQRQRVVVELFEPAREQQEITIELERFFDETEGTNLSVPMVEAVGAGRQQGTVAIEIAEGMRGEVSNSTGLFQVDASELSGGAARSSWAFAYGYATLPFALDLKLEKLQPRITVESRVDARLEPERLSVDLLSLYTIERRGVFKLELDVPPGYDLLGVRGHEVGGAKPVAVESYNLQGEDSDRLVVNLARKAIGRVGLLVLMSRRLQHPELRTPTEKGVAIPVGVPRVAPETRQQDLGSLVVHASESLRIDPTKTDGLRAVSFSEANKLLPPVGSKGTAEMRPVLAFRFASEPVALDLSAQRRKPQVTATQVLLVKVEEGVVKYRATILYDIRYSGVKSLRIDVPESLSTQLRNDTPGIRDKQVDSPEGPAPPESHTAWIFSGESELFGSHRLQLSWEQQLDDLEIGEPVALDVPRLIPVGVDRAWGQIVLAKTETIDVAEADSSSGLRPIDPQHDLVEGVELPAAARALEFHDDWNLALDVTRYELEDVKRTSVERALVQMVVTRSDVVSVQALYRLRSARQRLEVALPEGAGFDTNPLRINGRPVMLERGQANRYFLPLVEANPEEPLVLELRYTVPGTGSHLQLPEFLEDPAVQKVYIAAHLPPRWALLHRAGPWNEQFEFAIDSNVRWEPSGQPQVDELTAWVCEGAVEAQQSAESFQTDGQSYVFATLKPPPPPEGGLRLFAVNETWLHVAVFSITFLGGLLLLPAGVAGRALAVGVLVVVLVLAGVFFPIFAMQVLDDVLALALFIVAVLWVVRWFMSAAPTRTFAAVKKVITADLGRKRGPKPGRAAADNTGASIASSAESETAKPADASAEKEDAPAKPDAADGEGPEKPADDKRKRSSDEGGSKDE